jgi:hypothetical protein
MGGPPRRRWWRMRKFAVGFVLIAALGAACAKAGPESTIRSPNGKAKAAMAAAGITNLSGSVLGLSDSLAKAALVEAGIANLTGSVGATERLPQYVFDANGKRS